jgi:hypothetical protein
MSPESRHLNSKEISILAKNGTIRNIPNGWVQSHLYECEECNAWLDTMKEIEQVSPDDPYELTIEQEESLLDDLLRKIALLNLSKEDHNYYEEYSIFDNNELKNNDVISANTPSIDRFRLIDMSSHYESLMSSHFSYKLFYRKMYINLRYIMISIFRLMVIEGYLYHCFENGHEVTNDEFAKLLEDIDEYIETNFLSEEEVQDISDPLYS